MKNSIYLLAVFFFLAMSVMSQTKHSIYLLAGASTFEEKTIDRDFLYYPQPSFGLGYGISLPLKSNLSFSSGMNTQIKSGYWRYIELNNDISYDINSTINLFSVSIPAKINYTIPLKKSSFSLGAGGFIGLNFVGLLNTDVKATYKNSEYFDNTFRRINWKGNTKNSGTYDLKRLDIGTVFTIDYKVKRLIFGINTEIGFRNLSPFPAKELKFATRTLVLKFGYTLMKKKKIEIKE